MVVVSVVGVSTLLIVVLTIQMIYIVVSSILGMYLGSAYWRVLGGKFRMVTP